MPDEYASGVSPFERMILDRLKEIHQSLHDLRDEFHGVVANLTGKVSTLEEWRRSHDVQMLEWVAQIKENRGILDRHSDALSQATGAARTTKVMGAVLAAVIAAATSLLAHYASHPSQGAPQVDSTSVVPGRR